MNISTLDLNLLRVLDALLREGSTVAAGQRIGLSQPAVSAALGRLRHALGDPLFVRHGQRLRPTEYARSLELPLRDVLDRLEEVLSGPPLFDPALASETFRISGSDFFAEMLMPQLGDHLANNAPGIRVQLVDLVPDNYVGTLERYEVDLALFPEMAWPAWIDQRPVFTSSFAMIARRNHPRLGHAGVEPGGTVPLDLFCDLGHVLFSPEGNLSAMGDDALAAVGRRRRVVMTMPVFSGVCSCVARSDRVALVPRQYGEAMRQRLGLECYRPPMPLAAAVICMIWHRRSTNGAAHRWLRDTIADILEPLNRGEAAQPAGRA